MIKKLKEFGYGLLSVFLFQICLSIISIKTSINFLQLKNYTETCLISSYQLIGEIIISLLLIISIILFLFKAKAALILYISSIILSLMLPIFLASFTLENLLISLLIPGLTLLLLYIKRHTIFNM